MSQAPIVIDTFSDLLCVWAYVGQARIDELVRHFGPAIEVRPRCCAVFGDAHGKLHRGWDHRGGLPAYAEHVRGVAARFDHVRVNERCWAEVAPRSSMSAHLFLCATRLLPAHERPAGIDPVAWRLRTAFFAEARDISCRSVQLELAEELDLPRAALERALDDGAAHALLTADLEAAAALQVTMSPTLVLNEGRQHLQGNVGYRVIEANVRELLVDREHGASWC